MRCLNFFENGSLDFRDFQYAVRDSQGPRFGENRMSKGFSVLEIFLGKGAEIWVP